MVIVSDNNLLGSDSFHENVLDELEGGDPGELHGKLDAEHGVYARGLNEHHLFSKRGQEGRATPGGEDDQRVRFKRDDNGFALELGSLRPHPFKDLLMSEVDPVEVPQGGHRVDQRFL